MIEKKKIAVVGGGIAGVTTALYLSQLGLNITLFEKESSFVNGPPFCHLHAGGNLYREISDEQCIKLLKQSIDFLQFYPFVVDYRPTVIVLPIDDSSTPKALIPRLKLLQNEYNRLIKENSSNRVLGEASNYYNCYSREEIEALRERETVNRPQSSDEWMIPVAKGLELDRVQFPIIIVQEYGLNLFRLSAGVSILLEDSKSIKLHKKTSVKNIEKESNQWIVSYQKENQNHQESFDYIINATGFRTGKIDDMLGVPCRRMVEFKSAYVSRWSESTNTLYPEIIFHGERGTPKGMGQFTPYPDGYFQLHGMTKDITLYEDGLVANTEFSCQPNLKRDFIEKIDKSWREDEINRRTVNAIKHISRFVPSFSTATVGSKPLFGAQQIPGDDPLLRVAEVSFPCERYARCEIVKVSSVLDMVDAITKELVKLGYINSNLLGSRDKKHLIKLNEISIKEKAESIAIERNYPNSLAHRSVDF